jgi:ferredoxin
MAEEYHKVPENVPGKFCVDNSCIYCGLCVCTAPNNFAECHVEGYAYVFKQPADAEETEACIQALEGCPTESIGREGDYLIPIEPPYKHVALRPPVRILLKEPLIGTPALF